MRIQLKFETNEVIPLKHRLGILAIIKDMIHNGSNTYYEYLFAENKKKMKPFAYATYFNNLKIEKEHIKCDSMQVTVSSPDYEFMMHLMNGSQKGTTYYIDEYPLRLKTKALMPQTKLSSKCVVFNTLSPIHIEDKHSKPILASDDIFKQEIEYLANLIIREVLNREPEEPLKVLQTMMKKQVVKENLHQGQSESLYLTANKGLIQMQGAVQDLQCIYDAGLSMRRSLGFGLLGVQEEVM